MKTTTTEMESLQAEGLRWLVGRLAWERRLDELRAAHESEREHIDEVEDSPAIAA